MSPLDRILTLRQPWATLVIRHGKDVENRTWMTDYRGRLWIHAGLAPDLFANKGYWEQLGDQAEADKGHVIGCVDLIDCVNDSTSPWAERGYYHWILANPVPLATPIKRRGEQGLGYFTPQEAA